MDDFFIKEEHSPLLAGGIEFDLAVTAIGHARVPEGPILAPEVSNFVAFSWCTEGEMETLVNDDPNQYKASEVFIFPPGVTHFSQAISDVSEVMFFTFEGDKAWDTVLEIGLWEGVFSVADIPKDWFGFLSEKINETDPQSIGQNVTVAKDLMRYIVKQNRQAAQDVLAWDIEAFIRREWNNPELNVNFLIKKFDIHRSTASKKFKNRTGQSIINYLNNIRLIEAKRLLHNTNLPVKQIAQDCGFSDPLYFSRIFNKKEKMSPKKYRDQ